MHNCYCIFPMSMQCAWYLWHTMAQWGHKMKTCCSILAQNDLVLQLKYCMIGSHCWLWCSWHVANFWASLVLNKNLYQKLWQCDFYMLVTTKALLVATTRTQVIYNVSSGKWSTNLHTSITIYSDRIWLLVTTL